MPYIGKSPSAGVRQRYQYTATASQTTFSGTDTGNLTLNYTDNNFVDVFQNGVLLKGGGTDYTATSGTSVVLTTGASVSDVIEIIVYDAFSVGNFFNRTDSDSRYYKHSLGEELILDADGDTSITADTDDQIDFKIGGSDKVTIDSSGNVGIGTSSINRKLEISGNNNGGAKANYIRITDTDTTATASNQIGGIEFFSSDSSSGTGISASIETIYAGSGGGGEITFNTNATSGGTLTERMRIDESGNILVGTNKGQIGFVTTGFYIQGESGHSGLRFGGSQLIPFRDGSDTDDTTDLGASGTRFDDIFATNTSISSSDANKKNTIIDSDLGLDFINRLSPKSYIFNGKTRVHYGLIAQEVENVLSDINKPTSKFAGFVKDEKENFYGLRYAEFISPMIQAIKDLKEEVDTLKSKVTALESK